MNDLLIGVSAAAAAIISTIIALRVSSRRTRTPAPTTESEPRFGAFDAEILASPAGSAIVQSPRAVGWERYVHLETGAEFNARQMEKPFSVSSIDGTTDGRAGDYLVDTSSGRRVVSKHIIQDHCKRLPDEDDR